MPDRVQSVLKSEETSASSGQTNPQLSGALKRFGIAAAVLAVCFCIPLYQLVRFCFTSSLYSYILLIPFISVYLAWTKKEKLSVSKPAPAWVIGFSIVAVTALVIYRAQLRGSSAASENDRLCALTLSFVFFLFATCAGVLGSAFLRTALFPIGFLLFSIPLPSAVENSFSSFLQHSSAESAYWLLSLSGTPLMRHETVFVLPNITMEVAPECSGIRSSIVLIITSTIAAQFFLRRFWTKSVLVSAVVLLGIARNAFRIFVLAQLCIHVSPTIINSPLHHRGGPIFFVISLLPLLALIWFLRRIERGRVETKETSGN